MITTVAALAQTVPSVIGDHEFAVAKWIVDQGGVFAILLVILFFYRRDFTDVRTNLTRLVEQNIVAMQESKASNERLSRALEASNKRYRETDDHHHHYDL